MAGIYLHIPFCKQACHYCNFHFSTSLQRKNDFIGALLKEMEWRKDYLQGASVQTVYLGGGTPSLLTGDELKLILDRLRSLYPIDADAEITLEANPDDIVQGSGHGKGIGSGKSHFGVDGKGIGSSKSHFGVDGKGVSPGMSHGGGDSRGVSSGDRQGGKPAEWIEAGINRLSIGIQSFREADLQWMNRAHSASQAVDSIKILQDNGLDNISIDLIYGTPGLSDDLWEENIRQAVGLGISHLSCYALTVEPRTALDKMILLHKKEDVNPDDQARQFLLLMDVLARAGWEHYEISNFAKPGHRSRHNSSYWQGKPYLGLGPSAHSYNGVAERQWNIANNARYITAMETPAMTDLFEKETLTDIQRLNESIMISLRTTEGIDLATIGMRFGKKISLSLEENAAPYLAGGKMILEAKRLRLTREGKLLADGIAADLFFE